MECILILVAIEHFFTIKIKLCNWSSICTIKDIIYSNCAKYQILNTKAIFKTKYSETELKFSCKSKYKITQYVNPILELKLNDSLDCK